MNKYDSEDYYSVINTRTGKKIVDCKDECDALLMVSFDPHHRSYSKNKLLMSPVIDINIPKQLPTNEVVIQRKVSKNLKKHQYKLKESESEPVII